MLKLFLQNLVLPVSSAIIMLGCAANSGAPAETESCQINPPGEPMACTMQYDPVCGCDGKTYGNACGARGAGVPHNTPGACEDKSKEL